MSEAGAEARSGVITLEPTGDLKEYPCDCCGQTVQKTYGFIYNNGDAYAVYFALWADAHPELLQLALVLGDFGDEAQACDREAFGIEVGPTPEKLNMRVLDACESPWASLTLAPMLDRQPALAHPALQDVYHVVGHVLEEDPYVTAFCRRGGV